ncbi:MAG TPA: methyltransferase domain-containing protein [Anaerolineae bacterium]
MPTPLRVIRDFEYAMPGRGVAYYFVDLNDIRRRILADLPLTPGAAFLDVGTGDGCFACDARRLSPRGPVASIDLSLTEAQNAARAARLVGCPDIAFMSMDAYHMAFTAHSFDVVGSFLSVQDAANDESELVALLGEMSRVLKPQGRLVLALITPEDADNASQRLGIEIYKYIRAGFFSQAEIKRALDALGFQVEPARFYYSGVNLSVASAKRFIQFECGWWQDTFSLETRRWESVWEKFRPQIQELGGLEVDDKFTVFVARKKETRER